MQYRPLNRKYILVLCALLVGFSLFAQPTINSFTPLSGPSGTVVTLTGTGFNTVAANNIVYFGATKGTVNTATATSLTVTVPVGATYGPVTVTTDNLTYASRLPFLITYAGGDTAFRGDYFVMGVKETTGEDPYKMALGDIDGDGKPDIVVANRQSTFISVLRNIGTPGNVKLAAKIDFAVGDMPSGVAVGDLDGDGKLDVAVANKTSNKISVFRNISTPGNISFSAVPDLVTGPAVEDISIADLNGNGKPDIIVQGSSLLSMFTNLSTPGSISFAAKSDLAYTNNIWRLTVGDLTLDGKPEIIKANPFSGNVEVFLNTSTGGVTSFAVPVAYATGSYNAQKPEICDFDKNGMPDLIVPCASSMVIFRNSGSVGNYSFGTPQQITAYDIGAEVSLNDMDGDGNVDIVRVLSNRDSIAILRNVSMPGNIIFRKEALFASEYPSVFDFVTGDLDGDGKPDIAALYSNYYPGGSYVAIYRNLGSDPSIKAVLQNNGCAVAGSTIIIKGNKFTGATAVSTGGTQVTSFTVLSDTAISAVVATSVINNVTVANQYGTRTFAIPPPTITRFTPTTAKIGATIKITGTYLCGTTDVRLGGVPAASFTIHSDTSISAVIGSAGSGFVQVVTPYGKDSLTGFFCGSEITSVTPASGKPGATVTIKGTGFSTTPNSNVVYFGAVKAAVTAATDTELTVTVPAGATYQPVTVTVNGYTAYSRQPFTPTFEGGLTITNESFASKSDLAAGDAPISSAVADFDQDGKVDLAVVNNVANTVSVYRNTSAQGAVTFANSVTYNTGLAPYSAAVGDFDGDGKLDLAIANSGSATVSVFKNNSTAGAIAFGNGMQFPSSSVPRSIFVTDFDGDGKPDIAAVTDSIYQHVAIVIKNNTTNGTISFERHFTYPYSNLLSGSYSVCVTDFDNDGKPDLAATNKSHALVTVIRNLSYPAVIAIDTNINYTTGTLPYAVAAGDLNGDNKPELLVTGSNSNTLSVYKNLSSSAGISLDAKKDFVTGTKPGWVAVSDLDGNGKPDVAVTNIDAASVSVYANSTAAGSMDLATKVDLTSGLQPYHVAGADFDGDGKPELVAVNKQSNTVSILKNKVGEPKLVPSGTNPVTGNVVIKVTVDPTVQSYNGNPYVQRHYDIEPVNNAVTATATVTLYFTQQEFDAFNASAAHGPDLPKNANDAAGKANLRVYQYHGFSTTSLPGTYTGDGLEIDPDDSKIVWNANNQWWEVTFDVNGFSGFFVTSAGKDFTSIVNFVSFTANASDVTASLEWVVARIANVTSFEVLRSVDAQHFSPVTTVPATPATGTTNVKYVYADNLGFAPEYYYQIKMLYNDGSYKLSDVVKITSARIASGVTIYPNPAKRSTVIGHPSSGKTVQLSVIDMNGKLVKKISIPANTIQTKISTAGMVAGVYRIVWNNGDQKLQQNLLVE
ncbi:FG-GAP-like repeat-containing protein [Niastella sp. OAS944]|uniref:FG-GAP-like repeat-containing protein n=1 Tax=Niastella sp. OAS944 TaxID=2664089 RepID=UPI003474F0D9|nr:hypothetical protein [Chitinophagaceae bacterium OAS944]